MEIKFNPEKLDQLNNSDRLNDIPPELLANRIVNRHPQTIVDIGAGTGFFCRSFLTVFNPETIYACDLSDRMLNWMREHLVPEYPRIIPIKNKESSVPLDNNIAELVFMMNVHHELDNPVQMLKESHRILKPGGEVVIVDWKRIPTEQGPPLEIRYIPEKVKQQLEDVSFEGIQTFYDLKKHFIVTGIKKN